MKILNSIIIVFALAFLADSPKGQTIVQTITSSFNASGGVSIDDTGIVYVADFGQTLSNANGTKIYKVLVDGSIQLFASGLLGASGNGFDSQGNLFQSNIAGNFVSKITPDGTVSVFATAGISNPVGIAVGAGDTVYVTNCGSSSITKIDPSGNSAVWVSSGLLSCPNGLTIDDSGNVYTCNFNNGNIVKITPTLQVSILATLPGGRCGHLTYFEGNLYVVARCAQKIYKVTLAGDTSLVAGSGLRGNDDGPALLASFNHANGIDGIRDGDNIVLYINDAVSLSGNCTSMPLNPVVVRKITIGPLDINDLADADASIVTISDTEIQANGSDSTLITITPLNYLAQPATSPGIDSITLTTVAGGTVSSPAVDNLDGTFSSTIFAPTFTGYDTVSVSIGTGLGTIELTTKPIVYYWICGDVNGDGAFQGILELTYLVDFIFRGGSAPPRTEPADVNSSGGTANILDLTYMVDYVFRGGPAPLCL